MVDLWPMGKPCPWVELPFEILRDILSYASYPLFNDRGAPTVFVPWLLKFRHVHPTLFEASQAVLYYCPPITNDFAGHQFLSLMANPGPRTANYNVKVRHLELEARSTLSYSAGVELGSLDLGALVKQLPMLIGIDVWTVLDNPDIRRKALTARAWAYPDSLFEALSEGSQRLRHFHWNSRFMGKQVASPYDMYQWMRVQHQLPAFQSLTYLKLTSFLGDSDSRIDLHFPIDYSSPGKPLTTTQQTKEAVRLEKKAAVRRQDEALAQAVGALPNLRKLDLHMCSVVDGEWLRLLPQNLTHLGIIECDRLTSEDLDEFLDTHGQHLRVLVLNHNPALNISFLTGLARSCPVLEELVMDLTYFRKLASSNTMEERAYEVLMLPDERPTWPATLHTISMNHLHHWASAAAEVFFTSLIESAPRLARLRRLLLSVSLDVSWRDRARMRDMWEDKFKRVFLRRAEPPNPHWWSIGSFRQWKAKRVAEVVVTPRRAGEVGEVREAAEETGTENEGEVREGEDGEEEEEDEVDEEDMPLAGRRKRKAPPATELPARRLRPRRTAEDDDETTDASHSLGRTSVSALGGSLRDMVMRTLDPDAIQGLCDEVDVRIDNLRPREEQFHESDFLDSEPSGDEEWNGVDLDDEELYYRGRKGRGRAKGGYAW